MSTRPAPRHGGLRSHATSDRQEAARCWAALLLASVAPTSGQFLIDETQTLESPIPPPAISANLGDSVAWVDIDGDGRDDLVTTYHDDFLNVYYVVVHHSTANGLVLLTNQVAFSDQPIVAGCDFDPTLPGEEVIVGVPGFDVSFNGTQSTAGAVFVYHWTADANSPTELDQFTQIEVPDSTPESGDRFGDSLATGDFDGDGQCDLAIGTPSEDDGGIQNLGAVHVRWGPLGGGTWTDEIHANDLVASTPLATGDGFGTTLAAGDLDGELGEELAIGSPSNDDQGGSVGNVWVLTHQGSGGQPFSSQRLYPSTVGLLDDPLGRFGHSLAIGDLDGDAVGDLVIGALRHQATGGAPSSGVVAIVPGDRFDDLVVGSTMHRDLADLGLTQTSNDDFGDQVAVARVFGGTIDDLLVGVSGFDGGTGMVAVFLGNGDLHSAFTLQPGDLPNPTDDDDFGSRLAIGDADGDGSPDLAVGVPRADTPPTRGSSPGENLGRIHVLPTVSRLRPAEILFSSGETFLGQGPLLEFFPPRHNPSGEAVFVANTTTGSDEIAFTTNQVLTASAELLNLVGLDADGNTAWVDLADGELLSSSRGLIFTDGTPAPGGGIFDFGENDSVWLRGSEQLFLLTGTTAPLQRVLLHTDLATGTTATLLASGQTLAGVVVTDIVQTAASPNGQHWAALVDLDTQTGLVVDGVLIGAVERGPDGRFSRGGSGLAPINIAIGDDGVVALATRNDDDSYGLLTTTDDSVALDSHGDVSGIPLDDQVVVNVAISSHGEILTTWGSSTAGAVGLIVLSCPQPPDGRGIASTPAQRALVGGDPLDTDGDGLADAEVLLLDPASAGAPEITNDGMATVRAGILRDGESEPNIVAMRIPVPVCPSFRDGFEQGDTSAWSLSAP